MGDARLQTGGIYVFSRDVEIFRGRALHCYTSAPACRNFQDLQGETPLMEAGGR